MIRKKITYLSVIAKKIITGKIPIHTAIKKILNIYFDGGIIALLKVGNFSDTNSDYLFLDKQIKDVLYKINKNTDEKEWLIIVSHEASLTGAPVVALNIAQKFSKKYNVLTILLGDGELEQAFSECGPIIQFDFSGRGRSDYYKFVLDQLCLKVKFKAAIVNSAESSWLLLELAKKFIPSVVLVHEFGQYIKPVKRLNQILFWSTEIVFSSKLLRDSALEALESFSDRKIQVIPQGKCNIPKRKNTQLNDYPESDLLKAIALFGGSSKIVMGAGSIEYRKGVDLFISCACYMTKINPEIDLKFVWVGSLRDKGFDAYLEDQILKSGLQQKMYFLAPLRNLHELMKRASVFLLTSRVDPLPNVCIDAVSYGLPVICFDKASAFADLLLDDEELRDYVVGYLDWKEMAAKASSVILSSNRDLSERLASFSNQHFNLENYLDSLQKVIDEAVVCNAQEYNAYTTLVNDKKTDGSLMGNDFVYDTQLLEIRKQVRAHALGK